MPQSCQRNARQGGIRRQLELYDPMRNAILNGRFDCEYRRFDTQTCPCYKSGNLCWENGGKKVNSRILALSCTLLMASCAAMTEKSPCTYNVAFKSGVNDARDGRRMDRGISMGCAEGKVGLVKKGYREGYVKGERAASDDPRGIFSELKSIFSEPIPIRKKKCLEAYGRKACGFNCLSAFGKVKCAQRVSHNCVEANGEIRCGNNCRSESGSIVCSN